MRAIYDPAMVTNSTKPPPQSARQQLRQAAPQRPMRLFIFEWMATKGFSDQTLGEKMSVPRQTVYRWRTQQHRLDPDKQARIADALDLEPEQLWRPPGRRSVDAILKGATEDQIADAVDFVERFVIKDEPGPKPE